VTRVFFAASVLLALGAAHAAGETGAPPADETVVVTDRVLPRSPTLVEPRGTLTLDDALRGAAGFSLFRRQSSLVAHPTTQGASLRGVVPGGTSRVLVLVDGVPVNDPFGGWIYWSRFPLGVIDRIALAPGGHVGPFGSPGLGGVIEIDTRAPGATDAEIVAEGGNLGTVRVGGRGSVHAGDKGASLAVEHFQTDGYFIVPPYQRGAIDIPADSEHTVLQARGEWATPADLNVRLGGVLFDEQRGNGTPLTRNATRSAAFNARLTYDDVWLLAFADVQRFESTFSSQAADRQSETPALDQYDVPSTMTGFAGGWERTVGLHTLRAGGDLRWLDGETNEDFLYSDGRFTRRRKAGGNQLIGGIWLADELHPLEPLTVMLGSRIDVLDTLDTTALVHDLQTGQLLDERRDGSRTSVDVDPALAVRWLATKRLLLEGGVYRTVRAPTLNELVRPFRVRNDITAANPGLDVEHLWGGDVAIAWQHDLVQARLGGYWNAIRNLVTNVTVGRGPGTVGACGFVPAGGRCLQRMNLDDVRVRGVEIDVGVTPHPRFHASFGYLLSDATILEADVAPSLVGNRPPQIPLNQITAVAELRHPRWVDVRAGVRWIGNQFEDDRNDLVLGDYAVVDLLFARKLGPAELFLAFENALDRTYQVGKTGDGLTTIGAPLLVHGGVRAAF
jgi:outer membrane receptor protein involved in Fe transport